MPTASTGLPGADGRSSSQPAASGPDGRVSSQSGAGASAGGVSAGGLPGVGGLPGQPGIGSQSGTAGGGQPGGSADGQVSGQASGQTNGQGSLPSGGNYSLDNLPGSAGSGSGPLTAQERVAVLDGALNQGYEQFDGFILEERARAQAEANAARTAMPGGDGSADSGSGAGASPIIMADGRGSGPQGPQGAAGAGGGSGPEETFPPPEDIPSGRDDDVVARQLREAAMREPDPALREALWDEYRKYTGIGTD